MLRRLLLWCTYDGVITATSGVAVLTHYFVDLIQRVVAQEVNDEWHANTDFAIAFPKLTGYPEPSGNDLLTYVPLISDQTLTNPFGDLSHWSAWCSQIADWAAGQSAGGREVIIVAHDTAFLGIPEYLPRSAANVRVVLIPHSTSKVWNPSDEHKAEVGRVNWEQRSLNSACQLAVPVVAVSRFMKDHLISKYGVPGSNVLVRSPAHSVPYLNTLATRLPEANSFLDGLGIGSDDRVVLWSARSVPQKGHQVALPALRSLCAEDPGLTGLVFTMDDLSARTELANDEALPANLRVITQYPFELPRLVSATARATVAFVSSIAEPFGLVAEESVLLSGISGTTIVPVVSNVQGLREQAAHRPFWETYANVLSAVDAKAALSRALLRAQTPDFDLNFRTAYDNAVSNNNFNGWVRELGELAA